MEVIKDSMGEMIDVKLTTSFQTPSTGRSGTALPEEIDLHRRGSMTLNNVVFTDDVFRATGHHARKYHVDYHLQSMERTPEVENDVFEALKEDILFFFTPPVHAIPLNPNQPLELPRALQGDKKVACIMADMDTLDIHRLIVRIEDEEELHEHELVGPKDDRAWRKAQEWAMTKSGGMDRLIRELLS